MLQEKWSLVIPNGIRFADLEMTRTPNGDLAFSWSPIESICETNKIDIALFRDSPEDNICAFFIAWYEIARENGEPEDEAMEQLLREIRAEDTFGDGFSHRPGNA